MVDAIHIHEKGILRRGVIFSSIIYTPLVIIGKKEGFGKLSISPKTLFFPCAIKKDTVACFE
jgi:hypothetical protein